MITTLDQLAHRIGVPRETMALAVQTVPGGLTAFLRAHIVETYGEMNVIGRGANGKGVERAGECWERLTGRGLDGKKRRKG
jgi:hypothetical protein